MIMFEFNNSNVMIMFEFLNSNISTVFELCKSNMSVIMLFFFIFCWIKYLHSLLVSFF